MYKINYHTLFISNVILLIFFPPFQKSEKSYTIYIGLIFTSQTPDILTLAVPALISFSYKTIYFIVPGPSLGLTVSLHFSKAHV